ncbi:membrane protein [Ravibacter arvi]|uniref:Membrane protein n=1 Tax=Ravibacter arvi TaxID=2051041 RepID=A0ABP8M9H0_9BACT
MTEFDSPVPSSANQTVEEGKTTALISYLTIIGLVVALVLNNDKKNAFASFHIRQSLGIMLTGFAVGLVSWVPFIGWLLGLVAFFVLIYMWISGLLYAINGKEKTVPILGDKYVEWLKGI